MKLGMKCSHPRCALTASWAVDAIYYDPATKRERETALHAEVYTCGRHIAPTGLVVPAGYDWGDLLYFMVTPA